MAFLEARVGAVLSAIAACGASMSACASRDTAVLPACDASAALANVAPTATDVSIVATGDVADCSGGAQSAVASVIDRIAPDAVLALGDLAYPNGSIEDYLGCYAPAFGRFRAITRAVPGNHEYHTPHAGAYYAYFCGSSGAPFRGWYSFDVGKWHVVALNSNCAGDVDVPSSVATEFGGCGAGSPQAEWLRADLAAHPTGCKLAMWHHPRFSSSSEGSTRAMQTIWQMMIDAKVDVVLNGHAHDYQRFPPLAADGSVDEANGVRAFVVGTGGSALSSFDSEAPVRGAVRDNSSHGVLELRLHAASFEWSFEAIDGDGFKDEGEAPCRT